jgi:4-aminobutyrate aminotransferase-like enzyme
MAELERIVTAIPGPLSLELGRELALFEARGVTYLADDFPVFWESANGATVTDADGNRYLDLTSAFGVAATGHTNARVAAAIASQTRQLLHGMGDVHPTRIRTQLLARLTALAPRELSRGFLCSTGAEAVEFALKTALLATGRPGVIFFDGAYHGLSYGTLPVAGMDKFRAPFASQLASFGTRLPYGDASAVEAALAGSSALDHPIGAVIAEPIAGRAGTIVPPRDFLPRVRAACDRFGVILILDEIFTGFGRTGAWFACEHDGVIPDIMCVGKALGNGFPISATLGKREVFDAWAPSLGEALHTSTYLGNPTGCAAALANLAELEERNLIARAAAIGNYLGEQLTALHSDHALRIVTARGRGAMWAIDLASGARATAVVKRALRLGLLLLQPGETGRSIALTPPLVMSDAQLTRALELFRAALTETP